ncbi:hypothetical protein BD414DRAFT_495273 [Trametes punicea]|nr:hypothetical protein BD414DRAFT_495273 [Trametes punicea]
MKRFCPSALQYAVIRMDPVAMVEHFNDPVATSEALALKTKKNLVYLDMVAHLLYEAHRGRYLSRA